MTFSPFWDPFWTKNSENGPFFTLFELFCSKMVKSTPFLLFLAPWEPPPGAIQTPFWVNPTPPGAKWDPRMAIQPPQNAILDPLGNLNPSLAIKNGACCNAYC